MASPSFTSSDSPLTWLHKPSEDQFPILGASDVSTIVAITIYVGRRINSSQVIEVLADAMIALRVFVQLKLNGYVR